MQSIPVDPVCLAIGGRRAFTDCFGSGQQRLVNVQWCGDVKAVALTAAHFSALSQGVAFGFTEGGGLAGEVAGDFAWHLDSDRAWLLAVGACGLFGPVGQ